MNNPSRNPIEKIISASKPGIGHAPFEIRFVWIGLFFTISGGLTLGSLAAAIPVFELPFANYYAIAYQLHGHLQLVAWTGCFIIPISLHFIPRFAGIPLKNPNVPFIVFLFFSASLFLRFFSQILLPAVPESFFKIASWLVFLSAILFLTAIYFYIKSIFHVMGEAKKKIKRPALPPVAPFFMMVLAGWMGYAIVNTVLTFSMASEGKFLSDVVWDRFAVEFFIGFVLFPISFSFAIRTFPLYLRLPATDWSVRKLAVFFLVTSLLALIPQLPFMHTIASAKSANISAVGIILRSLAVLWLIWKLDVLTRLQMNWVQKYEVEVPGDNRRSTRPGMPDYGEFGKFELLIYAAFTWLVLGTILQIINEVSFLWQGYRYIIDEAIRHIYLLGFITNLILGMAPRMVPAFMGVKTVFRPNLVTWSFFLINFAAFARIIPKLASNVFTRFGNILYGISGLFAMASIILLWLVLFNSRKVFNREA